MVGVVMYCVEREWSYIEHSKHHVIVVDEEDQLFLPFWKLSCHAQNKILHFSLKCRETPVNLHGKSQYRCMATSNNAQGNHNITY